MKFILTYDRVHRIPRRHIHTEYAVFMVAYSIHMMYIYSTVKTVTEKYIVQWERFIYTCMHS